MERNHVLITGVNSGLGKHLLGHFKGVCFSRTTSLSEVSTLAASKPFKVIIHSAFNPRQDVARSNLKAYLDDTILLTQKLVQIPHDAFIFISTCDVYPKNNNEHHEDEDIKLKDVDSIYGISKLIAESIVQEEARNALILRPTALLGEHARKNSLIRLLTEEASTLTLSDQSTFNYVLHSDISEMIEEALRLQLTGIYNVAASENVSLREVADHFKCSASFGNYIYQTGKIKNDKAVSIFPCLRKTSLENIALYNKWMSSVVA